ncbi:hypothetical protein [Tessaracoccus lacteus]|uniref:Cell division protein FtsL n=1 Tax=Tessaracoccus lacteus TaxID=3041766 RepID=A0ABY8Q069_9ACTN|nr:hypothetical protein [Tessaracoccus sp. T21]WGT48053.1 hypothetical protein QH948_04635 [Tessaracoccus sp. T21]
MSAELIEHLDAPGRAGRRRPKLSVVQTPTATVSTLGFVGIILGLITLGLGAVMVVSTSVGAQSRELTALRREATELGYETAALTSQLQRLSSASALAMRATELGMVPNPYPAFINLGDSSVTGDPTPVTGKEMPFLRGSRSAADEASVPVTTTTTTTDGEAEDADTGDLSVADETSEESLITSAADDATQEDQ